MRRAVFSAVLFHAVLVVECATNFPQDDDEELEHSSARVSGLVATGQQTPSASDSHVKGRASSIGSASPAEDHTSKSDVQSQDGEQSELFESQLEQGSLGAFPSRMRTPGQTFSDHSSKDASDGPLSLKSESGLPEQGERGLISLETTAVKGGRARTSKLDIEYVQSPSMLRVGARGADFPGSPNPNSESGSPEMGLAFSPEELITPFSGLDAGEQHRFRLRGTQANQLALGATPSSPSEERSSASDEQFPHCVRRWLLEPRSLPEPLGAGLEWMGPPPQPPHTDNPSDDAEDEPKSLKSIPHLKKQAAGRLVKLERAAAQGDSPQASTSGTSHAEYPRPLRSSTPELECSGSVGSDSEAGSPEKALHSAMEKLKTAMFEGDEAWALYEEDKESRYLEYMNFVAAEKLLDALEEFDMKLCEFPRAEREKYYDLRTEALDTLDRVQQAVKHL